jgi:hypothetical protein
VACLNNTGTIVQKQIAAPSPVGRGADDRALAGLERSFISLSAFAAKVSAHD